MPNIGMVDKNRSMEKVAPYSIQDYRSTRPIANTYTMTGPTSGANGVASTAFTVALKDGEGTLPVVMTPADSGTGNAGVFSPTSLRLTDGSRSGTFTYTPGSTGDKVISVISALDNSVKADFEPVLTNPANITYTSS